MTLFLLEQIGSNHLDFGKILKILIFSPFYKKNSLAQKTVEIE